MPINVGSPPTLLLLTARRSPGSPPAPPPCTAGAAAPCPEPGSIEWWQVGCVHVGGRHGFGSKKHILPMHGLSNAVATQPAMPPSVRPSRTSDLPHALLLSRQLAHSAFQNAVLPPAPHLALLRDLLPGPLREHAHKQWHRVPRIHRGAVPPDARLVCKGRQGRRMLLCCKKAVMCTELPGSGGHRSP